MYSASSKCKHINQTGNFFTNTSKSFIVHCLIYITHEKIRGFRSVVLKPWTREAIFIGKKTLHLNHFREFFTEFLLRLLILVAREGFLKDKCGPRAKKFEHHCFRSNPSQERPLSQQSNTNALSPLQTRPYYSLRSL